MIPDTGWRPLLCQGCGKVIAKEKDGTIKIRHRGREVSFSALNAAITLDITCETCGTENHFKK